MQLTDRLRLYAPVVLLAPVLLVQGRRVRGRTPVLPEAGGARVGTVGPGLPEASRRIAVVGESTGAGVGVTDQRLGLAGQLASAVAVDAPVEWHVVARTGATAAVVRRDLAPLVPNGLDLVVVVLGVNDTLRLRTPPAWREEMARLVDDVLPCLTPTGRVAVLGVPDFGVIPALPRPLRTVLRRHGRRLDHERTAVAARHDRVLHLAAPPIPHDDAFCFDRFHPNAATYAAWAQDIARQLRADPLWLASG